MGESFNRMKLWLEVRRRMKFQPDETLAGGAALGESFNQLKLWLQVWGPMKSLVNLKKQNGPNSVVVLTVRAASKEW